MSGSGGWVQSTNRIIQAGNRINSLTSETTWLGDWAGGADLLLKLVYLIEQRLDDPLTGVGIHGVQ